MILKGKAKHIKRELHPAPLDSVHKVGRDGKIKGVHCIDLDGRLIPKGMNCIFIDKGKTGCKVFYSIKWRMVIKPKYQAQEIHNLRKLAKYGIAPKVIKKTKVKLDFTYLGKKIKCNAPAIEVETVDCPPMEGLARGIPYDWSCVDHPDHNPAGFLAFKKSTKKMIKKLGLKWDGSLKIGDVLWDRKKEKWMLVDCS